MSSIFARVWKRLTKGKYYVGSDLQGNKFFEHPSAFSGHAARPKRMVKYKVYQDMWRYTSGNVRLPVQWTSWMTHTRPDPPTLQELQADLVRQHRVKANALMIEERDREEVERLRADLQAMTAPKLPPPRADGERGHQEDLRKKAEQSMVESAPPPLPTPEIRPWQPGSIRRGS